MLMGNTNREGLRMSRTAYDAYSNTSILSADGVTLTTMLYDGLLKAIKKARIFHESRNMKGYAHEIERINLILGELITSLDLSQGKMPEQMSALYVYCMRTNIEASISGPGRLAEVEQIITNISTAWKSATATFKGTAAAPRSLADTAA